ncbi:hypothetical protein GCM10022393_07020 [Aquimarina addita]|uniref:Uncharacterized protein n=1 Tax=Aquimarina addita TaxID=870485 RepID=A0ABP7XB52_9FLAO
MKNIILTLAFLAGNYAVSATECNSLDIDNTSDIEDTTCVRYETFTSNDGQISYTIQMPC